MKPNFALSLSFEGIRLLHRAAGGWRVVGDVSLDAPDVAAELAVLRKTASALEPGGVRSKVLIPNGQIKYLTIPTPGMSDKLRHKAARAALDGATPYAVDDLVFDISADGDRTHIAAIARETLAEAEAFAVEHRLHPVSFAAVPGDMAYLGEPYFGETKDAANLLEKGETVEPDGIAVVVVGEVARNQPTPAQTEKAAIPADPPAKPAPVAKPVPAPVEKPAPAPVEKPAPPPVEKPAPAPVEKPTPPPVEKPAPAPVEKPTPPPVEKPAPAPVEKPTPPPVEKPAPAPVEKPTPPPVEKPAPAPVEKPAPAPVEKPTPAPLEVPAPAKETPKEAPPPAEPTPKAPPAEVPSGLPPTEAPMPQDPAPTAPPVGVPPVGVSPLVSTAAPAAATVPIPARPKPAQDQPVAAAPAVKPAPIKVEPARPQTVRPDTIRPDTVKPAPVKAAAAGAESPTSKAARPIVAPLPPLAKPAAPTAQSAGFASRRSPDTVSRPSLAGAQRTAPLLPAATAASAARTPAATTTEIPDVHTAEKSAGMPIAPDSSSLTPPPTEKPAAPAKGGFLSRRKPAAVGKPAKGRTTPAKAMAAGAAQASEEERMTIFGARRGLEVGGKPRFLGLILTVALLVFLAGVAAWASVFMDDGLNLSRLFGGRDPVVTVSVPDDPDPPAITAPVAVIPTVDAPTVIASLEPGLSDEDSAVLDALSGPVAPMPATEETEAETDARYAVTGIWPRVPGIPPEPATTTTVPEDLYFSSIDPVSTSSDAVALPPVISFDTDSAFAAPTSPLAAGTRVALDALGLVVATEQGALSPDGYTVYLGRPALLPPPTPTRFERGPEIAIANNPLADRRPRVRPEDLAEISERAQLGGVTLSELAGRRPSLRPRSVQERAAAAAAAEAAAQAAAATQTATVDTSAAVTAALTPSAPEPAPTIQNATRLAVAASVRPDTRPKDFSRLVSRAEKPAPKPRTGGRDALEAEEAAEESEGTLVASVAPRTVNPAIPSSASVAKQATVSNAINLRQINLIGVYGKPSSRRALIRLGNGRYQKVVVGDRIDGGRVSAIGDSELRYTKRGKNVVLRMPKG